MAYIIEELSALLGLIICIGGPIAIIIGAVYLIKYLKREHNKKIKLLEEQNELLRKMQNKG